MYSLLVLNNTYNHELSMHEVLSSLGESNEVNILEHTMMEANYTDGDLVYLHKYANEANYTDLEVVQGPFSANFNLTTASGESRFYHFMRARGTYTNNTVIDVTVVVYNDTSSVYIQELEEIETFVQKIGFPIIMTIMWCSIACAGTSVLTYLVSLLFLKKKEHLPCFDPREGEHHFSFKEEI